MGVMGGTVVLLGIAGLVLPVLPGWALIFVGIGILATEFAWARWVLKSAQDKLAHLLSQAEAPMIPLTPPPPSSAIPEDRNSAARP